jgi:hypothetical protein
MTILQLKFVFCIKEMSDPSLNGVIYVYFHILKVLSKDKGGGPKLVSIDTFYGLSASVLFRP